MIIQIVHHTTMDALSDTLYYALQGLETQLAMQHNHCIGLPCRQIVRTGVEVAQIMLGDEDVEEHKQTYYNLLSRRLYDRRDTTMAVIVMAALFSLIRNDRQAALCRNILTDDWCDEIYDVYHSYRSALDKQIDSELTAHHSLSFTISVMKTEQPQTVVYNYGTYNDIHDNPNATIYTTGQPAEKPMPSTEHEQTDDFAIPIPAKGKYTDVRRYIEERKLCDTAFKTYCDTHTRVDLCRRLTDEFGWLVDEHALGRNINRNR